MVFGTIKHFHQLSLINMPKPNLAPEIFAAALQGLEAQRARIDAQIAEVRRMLGARPQQGVAKPEVARPKRKLSAAARKRIAKAQKKRWVEWRNTKKSGAKAKN